MRPVEAGRKILPRRTGSHMTAHWRLTTRLVVLAGAAALLAVASATAQVPDDKLIVPGERIGSLRLAGKLTDLTAAHGQGTRGAGLWQGTVGISWPSAGLSAAVDERSGSVFLVSIQATPENAWSGVATSDGIGLESTHEKLVGALGQPTRTDDGLDVTFFGRSGGGVMTAIPRSLYYLDKGISFGMHAPGIIKHISVWRPFRAPGDTLVVPGDRISGVRIGMTKAEAIGLLGDAFVEPRPGAFHYWPHTGHYVDFDGDRVAQLQVTTSALAEWSRVRYATAQGLGFKSTPDQVRRTLGAPQGQERQGRYEFWVYRALGVGFVFDHQSPDRECVIVAVGPRS